MNEEVNNVPNTSTNNDTNVPNAQQSSNDNGNSSTNNSSSSTNSMGNSGVIAGSTIEQQAYKELYEEQKKQIETLKAEMSQIKLANQKLAIQQTTGTPRMSAEELINKMFN